MLSEFAVPCLVWSHFPHTPLIRCLSYLSSPVVTITVGHTVLTAHLALLQRSPFFNFSSSSAPLAVDGLADESLDAVGCFLQYLYTNEYTPRLIPSSRQGELVLEGIKETEVDSDGSHLLKHARVYTLAEKLGMEELKTLAHSKIHRISSTAKGELEYARFVYANTPKEDRTIRSPIASFWAHRSMVPCSAFVFLFSSSFLPLLWFADVLLKVISSAMRLRPSS